MRRYTFAFALIALAACSSGASSPGPQSTAKPRAQDPAIAIEVLDQLDTTTAVGRASWVIFPLIYSADTNKAGVAYVGSLRYGDLQPGHGISCVVFGSDSIGERQVVVLGLADTLHTFSVDSTAQRIAADWYAGRRTLPTGWMALASDSLDWGISAQFDAGHGRNIHDLIRWRLLWSGTGTVARTEAPADTTCTF